MESLTRQLSD